MLQFQTNFSPLFLELKNHYKHVLISPRYISGFQTLSPCRSRRRIVIVRSLSFSQLRVIITLLEMINELGLKTGPYVTCFLFFFSSKSTLEKSQLSEGHFTINKYWFQDSNFVFCLVSCSIKCFVGNKKLSQTLTQQGRGKGSKFLTSN